MTEMSNNEWETVQKVKTYRKQALEILKEGGSLEELSKVTTMGMNLRIAKVKESIEEILAKELSPEEKAQLIAEKLVTI